MLLRVRVTRALGFLRDFPDGQPGVEDQVSDIGRRTRVILEGKTVARLHAFEVTATVGAITLAVLLFRPDAGQELAFIQRDIRGLIRASLRLYIMAVAAMGAMPFIDFMLVVGCIRQRIFFADSQVGAG